MYLPVHPLTVGDVFGSIPLRGLNFLCDTTVQELCHQQLTFGTHKSLGEGGGTCSAFNNTISSLLFTVVIMAFFSRCFVLAF